MIELMKHQKNAITQLSSGKILWGGVGTGKSATVLGYYIEKESPKNIVVITTAKKRDSLEWEREAAKFGISTDQNATCSGALMIDSWNNIKKYEAFRDYFFIFDEQRLVGSGAWTKSFLKIAKNNTWVLLSATPGDTWIDYIPVFVANGFYKNASEFKTKHVVYEPFSKYPKIRRYLNEQHLEVLRNEILVEMPFIKHTERMLNYIDVDHDEVLFDIVYKERWNVYEERPVKDVSELFRLIRRVVNTDPSRLEMLKKLLTCHDRLIVFYKMPLQFRRVWKSLGVEIL